MNWSPSVQTCWRSRKKIPPHKYLILLLIFAAVHRKLFGSYRQVRGAGCGLRGGRRLGHREMSRRSVSVPRWNNNYNSNHQQQQSSTKTTTNINNYKRQPNSENARYSIPGPWRPKKIWSWRTVLRKLTSSLLATTKEKNGLWTPNTKSIEI